jgi:cytochrome d ubiquinol oxidase subunit I
VGLTLIIFVLVYFVVFGVGIYYMLKLMKQGPSFSTVEMIEDAGVGHFKTPMRPLSGSDEPLEDQASTTPSSDSKHSDHQER